MSLITPFAKIHKHESIMSSVACLLNLDWQNWKKNSGYLLDMAAAEDEGYFKDAFNVGDYVDGVLAYMVKKNNPGRRVFVWK